MLLRLALAAALTHAAALNASLPQFDNTCWDDDPLTPCPTSKAANDRYASLAMPGGHQPPKAIFDPACAESERKYDRALQLRSNASRCFEALRKRKALDDAEARQIKCDKTAMLAHTWWDGPMVRVVALFLRSFRATQNPTCAKLVVWTPTQGSERATVKGKELVEAVEAMDGAPVVFQVLQTKELAHGTPFEDYVNRAILPHDWSTDKPGDKKEGTRHFSDFFQLFILYLYGGVYFDADQVLLRDMWPLYGMHFVYQWSFDQNKFNNAVQGLRKRHGMKIVQHGNKLEGRSCCKGWGNAIWSAKIMRMSGTATYALPCSSWDPFWLRMDGHHTGEMTRPSLKWPEPPNRNWLFQSMHAQYGDWYDGAFGIHWHGGAGGPHGGGDAQSIWEPRVKPGSYFDHWEKLYAKPLGQAAPTPDLTIVSAANDRYRARDLAVLVQMREKATKEGLNVRIVSYNLGGESKCPDGALPGIWAKYGIEYREFNFDKYPSHVANLHCYAWKPPIIDEVLQESSENTVVMWVDSGATVVMSLTKIIALTKKNGGFLSDETAKGLARFSHEKQLDYGVAKWGLSSDFAVKVKELRAQGEGYLDNNDRLGEPFSKFRNCNGAFSAHMKGSRRYDTITQPWVACSLDRSCVCPQGSHRGNARQDQSALTLLAVRDDYVCGSDGKTVAAHGLRDVRGVLNANGVQWTARKEAQLFCPSSEGG